MSLLMRIVAVCLLPSAPAQARAQEDSYNASLCLSMGGETEVRHEYTYPTEQSYIRVDCETVDTVYESGLGTESTKGNVGRILRSQAVGDTSPLTIAMEMRSFPTQKPRFPNLPDPSGARIGSGNIGTLPSTR